ncbi:CBS domain containing membrane protein [Caldalkalibacillus thermarum TA2.A1]|uniref:Acetoin utilization AcuB family protein n=1 Tax=Caldalkalibacillus thermarum (strain TA2.A1) TaxID=986075 RepID=F5L838_CALTT|nr:acetoin utilization AcuB family protein [Caldalkalibacillus thermarum]EGL82451.1 CBS domain containing membrane protein [Caldalkalibacillus thermarum TA2.A1]QZT33196.1 acetoin utilization AcuB family protein [Caldalkalibacillus thermarum TA2.A1]
MQIEEVMKRKVITVSPSTTIREARRLCQKHRIRHLPVVEGETLVGIISDRDLRDALPSVIHKEVEADDIYQHPVSSVMKKDVITIHPLDFIEEAALTLYTAKIGCLPVVSQGKLVGIVTESDILHSLVELMGVDRPSSYLKIEVDDTTGRLADVAQIIKECHVNISNVYVYPSKKKGKKNLSFRVETIDPRPIIERIEQHGFRVIWPEKLDVKHNAQEKTQQRMKAKEQNNDGSANL